MWVERNKAGQSSISHQSSKQADPLFCIFFFYCLHGQKNTGGFFLLKNLS